MGGDGIVVSDAELPMVSRARPGAPMTPVPLACCSTSYLPGEHPVLSLSSRHLMDTCVSSIMFRLIYAKQLLVL